MRSKSIHNLHFVLITVLSVLVCSNNVFATQNVYDSAANTKLQNIYNYFATSNWVSNQSNGSPRYTDLRGVMFDVTLMLLNIQSDQSATRANTGQINNSLALIDTKLDAIYNNTDYVETHLANINSNTDYVETHLSNIVNNTNDLDKYLLSIADDSGSSSYKIFDSNFDTCSYFTSNCNYQIQSDGSIKLYNFNGNTPAFIGFANITLDLNSYYVCKFDIKTPVQLTISSLTNGGLMSQHIIPATNNYFSTLVTYTQPLSLSSFTGGIYIINGSLNSSTEIYIKNIKYYIDYNLQTLNSLDKNLNKLVNIYASDDVIAAKQNQQTYEDQAITDFTGSGNAAASTSDTTNMKNVSGAIKSGLDSGGSVSNALGVFNTSGGLWDWFSQSNYDEINGTQIRSRGSEEYIDFYNTNREELERLLMEDNR